MKIEKENIIEESLEKNCNRIKELREIFVTELTEFEQQQKERNQCSKIRRKEEAEYLKLIKKINKDISEKNIDKLRNKKLIRK